MPVSVREAAFEPYSEVLAYQQQRFASPGAFGASAVFVGTMRDFNEGDPVQGMTLEQYPGMTERHLEAICQDAAARRLTRKSCHQRLIATSHVSNNHHHCHYYQV